MPKYGLIGNPVSRSLSPKLFSAAYPGSGLLYDLIEKESFDDAFTLFKEEYDAVNITAPFKENAYKAADSADASSRIVGVANILKKEEGAIVSYNSDYLGVESILKGLISGKQIRSVLVIGCGGAGKAAAMAAKECSLRVSVANRDFSKAQDFCFSKGGLSPIRLDQIGWSIRNSDLIIYAIPEMSVYMDNVDLSGRTVLEANYQNPHLDRLTESFEGASYISGIEWLKAQAIHGFSILTGKVPDLEGIRMAADKK